MRLMIDAPGALTTVQDLGRTGVAHLGFCTCGAMDLTSMPIGWWATAEAVRYWR